ncbi:hypothetical protein B0A55_06791 [Friedmanniomyces simplex]|uniref:Mid2 domain-containing protein n=1 Tax=Friedmanniomyces simplex TaxID=329884 RepID=A0A4U0XBV8_9PEZI|nr:hypothetical protein B0A55_06791 [Friedmanniomyces simplex]
MPTVCPCYYPDGQSLAPDIACNASASESACCSAESQCLDNGLCFSHGLLSRGSSKQIIQLATGRGLFTIAGGSNFVLRDIVMAGQSPVAMMISPSTTLSIAAEETGQTTSPTTSGDAGTTQAVTVTASAIPNSITTTAMQRYTVLDIVAASAGTGAPLLSALLVAIYILLRQRRALRQQQIYRSSPPQNYKVMPPTPPQAYGEGSGAYYAELMLQNSARPSPPVEASAERELRELGERG